MTRQVPYHETSILYALYRDTYVNKDTKYFCVDLLRRLPNYKGSRWEIHLCVYSSGGSYVTYVDYLSSLVPGLTFRNLSLEKDTCPLIDDPDQPQQYDILEYQHERLLHVDWCNPFPKLEFLPSNGGVLRVRDKKTKEWVMAFRGAKEALWA